MIIKALKLKFANLTVNDVIRHVSRQGIFVAFIFFIIGFSLFSDRFLSAENLITVVSQSAIIGIMALGVTIVVINGNLDLSVGSMLSFGTVLVVDLHDKIGPSQAIVIMLISVLILGAINGFLVGFLKLNSLIVTLGMLSVIQGLTLIYSNGQNVDITNQEDTWFEIFGRGEIFNIPVPITIFFTVVVILHIILKYTSFGRYVYAVGGNSVSSVFSGINRAKIVFSTYMISAFTTGLAAIILGSRVMGSQNNVGQGYELLVLAGIILGGTSLLGGSGSIIRTVIGILILGLIQNGLLLLGFAYYVQWLVTWIIIVGAVWMDIAARRGRIFSSLS